jgi:phosphatidylinositol kinase/protein kinase (PI-3  family)
MSNQDVQQRFGLYLEVFLSKISRPLFRIFRDEDNLLKNLIGIAEKIKNIKNKEERDRIFREDINVIDGYLKINKKEVSLPLNFKYRIKGIIADKCRIMKSKKKPLWLTFENADPMGDKIVVMLKCGDDLRMDMVTLQLFKAMQTVWFENGLNVKMSLYKVLCTGNQQGMLEMVTNAETLANIHVKGGGAINQFFSKNSIKNWIEKNCASKEEAIDNFMLSNVAYCLATFVLGIGDRHNDNIMIKKNGELFHIDFGHFLGHFKYKMGIKRERAPFVFTRQFQNVLGGDDSEAFKDFKNKLIKGYIILRNNKEVLITLMSILLCTGIPELNEKSLRFLENSLLLKKDDKEAIEFLNKKLNESMDSVSTKLNFAIHIVANK